ncbi:MAG: hypothetical protein E7628_07805 [Ruminococcaceae bacterium]|nr:hypothetical protein [Oscillospiraceae bacterium]
MKGKKKNYITGEGTERGAVVLRAKKTLIDKLGGVRVKRIMSALLCFVLAAVVTGTQLFPGTYPLGIALVGSSSGIISTFSTLAGTLVGTSRIAGVGGIYALALTTLAAARLGASVWLESGRADETEDKRKRSRMFSRLKKLIGKSPTPRAVMNALATESKNYSGIMLRENIRIRLALSACGALLSGAWSVVEGGYVYYDLFGAVFSLLITPVVTYLFYVSRDSNMRSSPLREIGVYSVAAAVTLSLCQMSSSPLSALPGEMLSRPNFNLGVLFAFAASVVVSRHFGVHRGVMIGMICGMVMEPAYVPAYGIAALTVGALSNYSVTFALLASGISTTAWAIYVSGIDGFADVFPPVVLSVALLIPAEMYGIIKLPEKLFGGVGIAGRISGEAANVAELSAGEMNRRINSLSDGLASVSTVLHSMAERLSKPSKSEMREIVETAFETYCPTCKNRERCGYGTKSSKSAQVMPKMAEELHSTGVVSAAAVPSSLASFCYSMGRILDEINLTSGKKIAAAREGDKLSVSAADLGLAGELFRHAGEVSREISSVDTELSKKLQNILSYNNFSASTVTAYGSRMKHIFVGDIDVSATNLGGDDIRKLFEKVVGSPLSEPEFELDGASLSMRMHTVYSYSARSGSYSAAASSVPVYYCEKRDCDADCRQVDSDERKKGEKVCIRVTDNEPDGVSGDAICTFESDGRFYMILSDGMGSGKEAALTSGVVVSLLRRLISSGADLECALKLLNRIVRSADRECSATVDIAEIDLVTGEARFIKSGAAPSFVLRDGSIFRLQSKTVPIGIIRALDAEMIKFDVQPGDTVVMLSDGVARSYDEVPWLLDMMTTDETVLAGDERRAAMAVVSEAAIRGSKDDITAGVVRISRS